VLGRICAGQRMRDIALGLGLSIKTVSTHKVRLMTKLGVASNADLIRLGMKHGLG
jgi:DNA-binding CsgD family transcriptional regulator